MIKTRPVQYGIPQRSYIGFNKPSFSIEDEYLPELKNDSIADSVKKNLLVKETTCKEFEKDGELLPRDLIKLPVINQEKVELAKLLASKIKEECEKLGHLDFICFDDFKELLGLKFNELLSQENLVLNTVDDEELINLTTYMCVKTKLNPTGFFERFPRGFFTEDLTFEERIRTVGRYAIIHLLGLDSALKIENFQGWSNEFKKLSLQKIIDKKFSTIKFLKIIFPDLFKGGNPPIREWFIQSNNKWTSSYSDEKTSEGVKDLAKRACFWVLKYGEKAIDKDGSYNLKKIREIEWGKVFYKEEYGLKTMMDRCPYTKTVLDALNLAVPGLIGFDENQLKPWEVRRNNMWKGNDGKELFKQAFAFCLSKDKCGSIFSKGDFREFVLVRTVFDKWYKRFQETGGKHFIEHMKKYSARGGYSRVARESINRAFAILLNKEGKLPEDFSGRFLINELIDEDIIVIPLNSFEYEEKVV